MAADISSSLTVSEGHSQAMVPPGTAPTGPSSLRPLPEAAVKRIALSGLPSRRKDHCELEPLTFVRHLVEVAIASRGSSFGQPT